MSEIASTMMVSGPHKAGLLDQYDVVSWRLWVELPGKKEFSAGDAHSVSGMSAREIEILKRGKMTQLANKARKRATGKLGWFWQSWLGRRILTI